MKSSTSHSPQYLFLVQSRNGWVPYPNGRTFLQRPETGDTTCYIGHRSRKEGKVIRRTRLRISSATSRACSMTPTTLKKTVESQKWRRFLLSPVINMVSFI